MLNSGCAKIVGGQDLAVGCPLPSPGWEVVELGLNSAMQVPGLPDQTGSKCTTSASCRLGSVWSLLCSRLSDHLQAHAGIGLPGRPEAVQEVLRSGSPSLEGVLPATHHRGTHQMPLGLSSPP